MPNPLPRSRLGVVVGVLDGAGLAAMPSEEVEPAATLGIGAVGDDGEVLHARAIAQEIGLAWPDADRQIAAPCTSTSS